MNRVLLTLGLWVFGCLGVSLAAGPVIQPATQAQVNAGANRVNYVTPYTLANWTGGGGGLTVGDLSVTNYIPRVLISDVTPQDQFRWINATNGQLIFPAWSQASIVGSQVPGVFFVSVTNPATVLGQLDVQHDHAANGRSEMRMITLWDMALVPGYNAGMQLGASTDNYNQNIYVQYGNRIGWSHLFSFRTYTNGQTGGSGFALQGRRDLTTTNLSHLVFFAKEPTWNSYPAAGFSDPGIQVADLNITGSYIYSSLYGPLITATNRLHAGNGTRWGSTDGGLEVTGGYSDSIILGGDTGADSRTDGADKSVWITMAPKNNSASHLNLVSALSSAGNSVMNIGGGTSVKAAYTAVRIYTGDGVNSGAGTLGLTVAGPLVTTTNLLAPQYDFTTNTGTMSPNFALGSTWIVTNAAFAVLAPSNVDTTRDQTTVFTVTNSTAAAVAITPPANCFARGVWYVTNLTRITFNHYGPWNTNATADPIF